MFGAYVYENELKFMGVIAKTEDAVWAYLDKIYGKEICGVQYGCNRDAFEVKEIQTK